jgi:hypothetical protein
MSLLQVPNLGEATYNHLGYPLGGFASLKHQQLARQVGDLAEDAMANLMDSVIIKPNVTFKHDNTFIFDSWVCTANNTKSFRCYLTMTSDPETGFMMLPEATTDQLVKKFDKISLSNNSVGFEFGSASNSTSTSTWVETREPAPKPSCGLILPHEQFT